jgi:hypothetical protein
MLGSQVPVVGKTLFPARVDTSIIPGRASESNHAFDSLFAHFSIFEYPGNTRKIHDRIKVEVNLTKKSIDNKKLGILDRFGGNQVVAVMYVHH